MSELRVFNDAEFGQVRSMTIDDEPWFVGRDVALSLGYAKPEGALKTHVDGEDKMPPQNGGPSIMDSMGRKQHPIWINESGLYSLILSSKLPSAKRFKRWVTSEILPSIRKTGKYKVQETPPDETPPLLPEGVIIKDDYIRAASIIAGCKNDRLPYVFDLLKQAGIETAVLPPCVMRKQDTVSVQEMLRNARHDYGITLKQIESATGISLANLCNYSAGRRNPRREQAEQIAAAIDKLIDAISA